MTKISSHPKRPRTLTDEVPRRVGMLIIPGGSPYELGAVSEIFSTVNGEAARRLGITRDIYTLEVISTVSGPVTLEMGLKVVPDRGIHDACVSTLDTLIVCGGCKDPVEKAMGDAALIRWLQREASRVRRVVSLCTGAFLLAEAGVFKASVTTHWAHCETFKARYPHLMLQPDHIYIKDGNRYSSAGSTAAIDLTLALVEEDVGRVLTMHVARRLVIFLKRPGGQSQFSQALMAQSTRPGTLNGVPDWVLENLRADLSVEALAARAVMSPRNFARVFLAETGLTPAKYVERARVEKAREMIEDTTWPVATIAAKVGFEDERQMRRAFTRMLKITPSDYVARFRRNEKVVLLARADATDRVPLRRRA